MNDDELEALLRTEAPIADEGFTARVVHALPPAPRRAPRMAILLGATTLASGIAFLSAPDVFASLIEGVRQASSATPFLVLGAIFSVVVGAATQEAIRAST